MKKRIEWINTRLAEGYKLLKKHGVQTTAGLLQLQKELENKIAGGAGHRRCHCCQRKRTIPLIRISQPNGQYHFQSEIPAGEATGRKSNRLLMQVGMPNAKLKVQIGDTALQSSGKDQVEFLFDANKSQSLRARSQSGQWR